VVISLGILYYYFHDEDWNKIWEACKYANLALALLAIVIPQLIFWFFEALIYDRHLEWFHAPFPFWRFFWVRGQFIS